ncbi:MAG: hypothetical protein QOI30_2482 [Mycobacterium sp.]|nr:hypothetical protein [Mycobacterium sp.]
MVIHSVVFYSEEIAGCNAEYDGEIEESFIEETTLSEFYIYQQIP